MFFLPEKALKGHTPEELINTIAGFFESIKEAARVAVCSTSSCIYDANTGKELRGKSAGFHLYLFPQNAADTPRFLDVLGKRLILAGYGRVEFSRSGAVLVRKAELLAYLQSGSGQRHKPPLPFLDDQGKLRIPLDADGRYRYWQGGQSVFATLLELGASDREIEAHIGPISIPESWRRWQRIKEGRREEGQ